jgi:hypothetical protein
MRIVLLAVALLLILLLALASRPGRPQPTQSASTDLLVAQLQRWTTDGQLSQEQATAILTAAHSPRPAHADPIPPPPTTRLRCAPPGAAACPLR